MATSANFSSFNNTPAIGHLTSTFPTSPFGSGISLKPILGEVMCPKECRFKVWHATCLLHLILETVLRPPDCRGITMYAPAADKHSGETDGHIYFEGPGILNDVAPNEFERQPDIRTKWRRLQLPGERVCFHNKTLLPGNCSPAVSHQAGLVLQRMPVGKLYTLWATFRTFVEYVWYSFHARLSQVVWQRFNYEECPDLFSHQGPEFTVCPQPCDMFPHDYTSSTFKLLGILVT